MRLNEALVLRKTACKEFDYGALDNPTSQALRSHARRLSSLAQSTATNLWQMGQLLAEAQDRLASYNGGSFVDWVENEAGLSKSTAYRLMNVHKAFSLPTVGKLNVSARVLYLLSEPSAPQQARDEAFRRATNGETITHATAQEIVRQHQPPPMPARPTLPPLPPRPPSPEYQQFEREELRPKLHDAGVEDAPQMLSGQEEAAQPVPQECRDQARTGLRETVMEALRGVDTEDEEALEACAEEMLGILGQSSSISIAARFGAELREGPKTLSDLVALAGWVCDVRLDKVDRAEYLRWRKRVLRLVDAITLGGGLAIYEHTLENGQICYSLIKDPPSCP